MHRRHFAIPPCLLKPRPPHSPLQCLPKLDMSTFFSFDKKNTIIQDQITQKAQKAANNFELYQAAKNFQFKTPSRELILVHRYSGLGTHLRLKRPQAALQIFKNITKCKGLKLLLHIIYTGENL